jgi:hypothetical protein
MQRTSTSLAAMAFAGLAAIASLPAQAADPTAAAAAKSTYLKDRADCDAGKTAEDRATCLKEAGAAQVERKRNTLDNNGSLKQNAKDRCDDLPMQEKSDCMARVKHRPKVDQHTTTTGSVAGGGILKETTTITTGEPTIVMVPPARPASSP